jgi:sulfite reductase alpha subunit-like flavoprotein
MKKIVILHAGETGTAEDVAYSLYESMSSYLPQVLDAQTETASVGHAPSTSFSTLPLSASTLVASGSMHSLSISSMDNFDYVNLLPHTDVAVFIISTTGDGDVPANMKKFWSFILRRSLTAESLKGVCVAVFGLGDSSYEKFNAAARFYVFS